MSRITRSVLAAALTVTALPALATTSAAPAQAETRQDFHRLATYPVYRNLPSGVPASSATVAEISAVTADGDTLIYTDALGKRIAFLDIGDPAHPEGAGSYDLTAAGDPEDEPTSVAVAGRYVLVVVNTSESYAKPSGRLDVVRISDAKRIRSIDLGGQPDSIALSKDGRRGIVAIENERDEEFAPEGLHPLRREALRRST